MKSTTWSVLASLLMLGFGAGCERSARQTEGAPLTIGVAFETLQTEFWVASIEAFRTEAKARGITLLEAIADGDANRQLEQIKNFISRRVDGIIAVPKDAQTIIPMIRAAHQAQIPMVLYNRPPDPSDAPSITVVADNYSLTKATVSYMAEQALKTRDPHQAMILIGDLGDINAIGRRDGFEDAIRPHTNLIQVVSRVPTEWNLEKAQAGVVNALQAHPDIRFIFTSSDFLLPAIVSALKSTGRYHKIGEPGHIVLGGFDGDATAYRMLEEGYLDATGVQDVHFEVISSIQAILDSRAGKPVAAVIKDPGFVIHQGNLKDMASRMWGATIARQRQP